ncbi:MAG TPA: membrane protein insertase YidC, partial [Burkholderiaceae bacterium]|nr:membrane protein insertase YidC [Burkholderiaceae bacterium]
MTDMRRTLLWVVFVMSLVLLWDGWNRHTGAPTMFGGTPARSSGAASASAPAQTTSSPSAATGTVPMASTTPTATPAAAAPTGPASPAAGGELITLTTDTVKATIDSRGGELVRLELLQHRNQADSRDLLHWFGGGTHPSGGNVVLFDRSAQRLYFARTGLATVDGTAYPNHETVLRALPGPREIGGADTLQLTLESPVINGVQLRKT